MNSNPLDEQVGGDHYKNRPIQPVEYILKNKLGYAEGCVVKYVTRWESKGGVEDLKKARQYLDILIHDVNTGKIHVEENSRVKNEDALHMGDMG